MFSRRTPALHRANRLTGALTSRVRPYADLTVTNPTAVGLPASPETLLALADPRGTSYDPDPRGLRSAREAVASLYAAEGLEVDPDHLVLAASSSEAYSWIFKLLCEPGDAVLVPAPSYPLLDALAELEAASVHRYPLDAHDGWSVSAHAIERRIDELASAGVRVAVVVLVNPNNPTGSSIADAELRALLALSRDRGFAVVSDEVFLDYRYRDRPHDVRVAAARDEGLVLSLGGLSKSAALPQLKLSWMLVNGPDPLRREALSRLEWIADSFLSVGTPVQLALPRILREAGVARGHLRTRIEENLSVLRETFPEGGALATLPVPAGWSAVVRYPATRPEEDVTLALLEEHDVLVHPGYFFEFPFEAFAVLSLLPRPDAFRLGALRLARGLHELLPSNGSA